MTTILIYRCEPAAVNSGRPIFLDNYVKVVSELQERNNDYDEHDVKQMLREIGLADDIACAAAIGLHERLQGAAVVERFCLLQLLQAGRLVTEKLERGVSLGDGVVQGFTDVYVRGLQDVGLKQVINAAQSYAVIKTKAE